MDVRHPLSDPGPEIDVLAAAVHGAGAFLNLLGVFYNWRRVRRVDLDVLIQAGAATYHVGCVVKHVRRASSFIA